MKRILAIVLCALMLMTAAVAEQEMQAWGVTVSNISVSIQGETVNLSPTLQIETGRDASGCWAQLAVLLGDEAVLTGQVEYVGDTLFGSVDGAEDALLIEGAELFLNQYNLTGAQVRAYADALYNLLATGTDVLSAGIDPKAGALEIQMTGESAADFTFTVEDAGISAHLDWAVRENELPYDLSAKNVCRYTFREMTPGDGTDIPEAVNAALNRLAGDESLRELMELLSGMVSV